MINKVKESILEKISKYNFIMFEFMKIKNIYIYIKLIKKKQTKMNKYL